MSPGLLLLFAILFNVAANYVLKAKAEEIDTTSIFTQISSVPFIISIMLFGSNLVFYSRALKQMELSLAYPILVGSSVLAIYLLSLFFLGERVSWMSGVGAVLVVLGVMFISAEVKA